MTISDRKFLFRLGLLAGVAASGLASGGAFAQTSDGVSEVVVTAERQGAVTIQKAPIAVSVIDSQAFDRQGGSGFSDYLTNVPSVSIQESGPGQNKFNIRGLSTQAFNQTDTQDRSLVSVYLDDTPISIQGNTPDLKIYDLERVEVVRGPQGTLYGAGAMAGNIRLVTIKPNLTQYSGYVEATAGGTRNLDNSSGYAPNYSLRGSVNIPLVTDKVALKASIYNGQDGGYINNLGTGTKAANGDIDSQGRLALRFLPTDKLTIDASATYAHLQTRGLNTTLQNLGSNYSSNIDEHYRDELAIFNITGAYDLGWANLTSSTSYIHRAFGLLYSWQYALHRYVYKKYTDAQTASIIAPDDIGNKLKDVDEEIKLTSSSPGPFHWVGGFYYQHEERNYVQNIINPGLDAFEGSPIYSAIALGAPVANDAYFGDQNVTENQYAVFGEAKYDITNKLSATVGLRYFNWTQDFNLYQAGLEGAIYPAIGNPHPLTSTGETKENGVNPRFAVSYQAQPNLLLFAEAAKGFRYGGVNYPLPNTCAETAPTTFDPDHLWSYQVGEKAQLFDRRLTLNVTGFYIDWSNVQTRKVDPSCSYFFIVSGGKIQSRGAELEATATLMPHLTLSFSGSYNDSTANGPLPNIGAVNGDPTPYAPKYVASTTLAYDWILPDSNLVAFSMNWRYRDGQHTDFDPSSTQYFGLPANNKVDLAVNYIRHEWELGVFARNITDSKDLVGVGTNYVKLPTITNYGHTLTYGRPTTLGVRVKATF